MIEEKIIRWAETKDEEEEERPRPSFANRSGEKRSIDVRKSNNDNYRDRSRPKKFDNRFDNRREADKKEKVKPGDRLSEPLEVICSFCGGPTIISFEPDPNKPIYCQNCLKLAKEGKIPAPSSIKKVREELPNSDLQEDNEGFVSLADALKMKPQPTNAPVKNVFTKENAPAENESNVIQPGQTIRF